jgi:Fe-S-cluster containining protein
MMLLPCTECRGQCCTYPAFSEQEFRVVKLSYGVPEGTTVMPIKITKYYDLALEGAQAVVLSLEDGTCPYLKDGRCSIYASRPKTCRDYGNVPKLPCQYLYPEKAAKAQQEMMGNSPV